MAEGRDEGQERTEQATPKRLQQAREKGQIARSRELTTTVMLVVGAGALLTLGPGMGQSLGGLMKTAFTTMPGLLETRDGVMRIMGSFVIEAFWIVLPFLGLTASAAVLAPMALGGWSFSPSALALKLDKLDPIKGTVRLLSWRSVMELVKALIKFLLVGSMAAVLLWQFAPEILGMVHEPLRPALQHGASLVAWIFLGLGASIAFIALFDVPFQVWDHARQLKMTLQEIKDEFKETEGKPEVKSKIRQLQREAAQRRMMEEVPKADVVITNPTHFAVALRYDADRMNAPLLVAKGRGEVALRIRELAREHHVVVYESPGVARAVFRHTELGEPIPAGLYLAVAQILAHVQRINDGIGDGGMFDPEAQIPGELRVPGAGNGAEALH